MPGPTYLRGDRLHLHTVEPDDYGFLVEHANDPAIRAWVPAPTPISEAEMAEFVEADDPATHFLACRDGEPLGFVFLFHVRAERDHAELGYWVVPDAQGRGYATEAAALCLGHAFEDRGLHKVFARVFDGNEASMRVLEKLGFEREGCLREQDYLRGEHRDTHLFGLLADEWTG